MEVEKHVGPHPEANMIGNIPHTPRVKKVLALGYLLSVLETSAVFQVNCDPGCPQV
jgi:hypothetical protein